MIHFNLILEEPISKNHTLHISGNVDLIIPKLTSVNMTILSMEITWIITHFFCCFFIESYKVDQVIAFRGSILSVYLIIQRLPDLQILQKYTDRNITWIIPFKVVVVWGASTHSITQRLLKSMTEKYHFHS